VKRNLARFNTYKRAGEIKAGSFGLDEPSHAEIERRRHLAASE